MDKTDDAERAQLRFEQERHDASAAFSLGVSELVSVNGFVNANGTQPEVVPPESKELTGTEAEQNEEAKDEAILTC